MKIENRKSKIESPDNDRPGLALDSHNSPRARSELAQDSLTASLRARSASRASPVGGGIFPSSLGARPELAQGSPGSPWTRSGLAPVLLRGRLELAQSSPRARLGLALDSLRAHSDVAWSSPRTRPELAQGSPRARPGFAQGLLWARSGSLEARSVIVPPGFARARPELAQNSPGTRPDVLQNIPRSRHASRTSDR